MARQAKGSALITGASSGIGAAFSRQLASQGYDLILVARRLERLETLAEEIKGHYSVCVETMAADLTDAASLERLEKRIVAHDQLTMLVNNAGFGTVGSFVQVPLQRHLEMIQVHVMATTRLCYAVLPNMMQRKQGAIINVSSIAAFMPATVGYSASKAYLNLFSEALQLELKKSGIAVQALCPGLTHTEFHDRPEFQSSQSRVGMAPKFMWMSADDVVAASLRALGRGSVICIPGWLNWLMVLIARSALSPWITRAMMAETLESKQNEPLTAPH
jgi:short-subunit dehydrogenase